MNASYIIQAIIVIIILFTTINPQYNDLRIFTNQYANTIELLKLQDDVIIGHIPFNYYFINYRNKVWLLTDIISKKCSIGTYESILYHTKDALKRNDYYYDCINYSTYMLNNIFNDKPLMEAIQYVKIGGQFEINKALLLLAEKKYINV